MKIRYDVQTAGNRCNCKLSPFIHCVIIDTTYKYIDKYSLVHRQIFYRSHNKTSYI